MSDDVAGALHDALDAAATAAVDGARRPPPFDPLRTPRPPRRRHSWLPPLLAAAAVALVAVAAARVFHTERHQPDAAPDRTSGISSALPSPTATRPSPTATRPSPTATQATKPVVPTTPVHVSLFQGDGQTYGIGMPIIAQFSKKVTSAHAFDKAVTVTVNGKPANGAWFWVYSSSGYAMEAHYRPDQFWPAHSKIEMTMPIKGLSAGSGLVFDDSLTLSMNIGAAHVSTVNGSSEQMTVASDGRTVKTFGVSLGKASTPTYLGTKVVMEKKNPQHMVSAPGEANPYSLEVPWSVRLTNSGEFVHAAAWNTGNIGSRSTSHGCTNLTVADAQWFYNFSIIGDVVTYSNTGTSNLMPSWDGLGDWNVPWSQWQEGNLLKN
jgi:lipoprotein-anchoring transpeptidase ErfK/SrfK